MLPHRSWIICWPSNFMMIAFGFYCLFIIPRFYHSRIIVSIIPEQLADVDLSFTLHPKTFATDINPRQVFLVVKLEMCLCVFVCVMSHCAKNVCVAGSGVGWIAWMTERCADRNICVNHVIIVRDAFANGTRTHTMCIVRTDELGSQTLSRTNCANTNEQPVRWAFGTFVVVNHLALYLSTKHTNTHAMCECDVLCGANRANVCIGISDVYHQRAKVCVNVLQMIYELLISMFVHTRWTMSSFRNHSRTDQQTVVDMSERSGGNMCEWVVVIFGLRVHETWHADAQVKLVMYRTQQHCRPTWFSGTASAKAVRRQLVYCHCIWHVWV